MTSGCMDCRAALAMTAKMLAMTVKGLAMTRFLQLFDLGLGAQFFLVLRHLLLLQLLCNLRFDVVKLR